MAVAAFIKFLLRAVEASESAHGAAASADKRRQDLRAELDDEDEQDAEEEGE